LNVRKFSTVAAAARILSVFDGWVGTPVIWWQSRPVDGRIRLDAWKQLRFPGDPPAVYPKTNTELVRHLVLAGEHARAAQHAGAWDSNPVARAVFKLTTAEAQTLMKSPQSRRPKSDRASTRERLHRIRQLYWGALEAGRDGLELEAIEETLEGWAG